MVADMPVLSMQDDAAGQVRPDLHRLYSWCGRACSAAMAAGSQVRCAKLLLNTPSACMITPL